MEFNNPVGFRSRRSYPNLHHISLAPLTPRFPIDDLEPTDYFSPRDEVESPRTSYLSSVSVPSTPPILSHSRSNSRTRHTRSKSSTRSGILSDSNLHSKDVALPLHHQIKKRNGTSHHQRPYSESQASKSDAEWMLRAGIALASSTREEKGQSWLSKRESSTSLVSMPYETESPRHHNRTKSSSSRKSRSGASTPALSRRNSRSRGGSRRGSRAGLAMTSMPLLSGRVSSSGTGTVSPEVRVQGRLEPDFVDEEIRAEIAALQRERGISDEESEYWDEESGSEDEDDLSDRTLDEFDEADLQRLTRERGFGLGTWIDRLVEWTLFGVDELPVSVVPTTTRIGAAATTTTVTFEEPDYSRDSDELHHDNLSLLSAGDEADGLSLTDGESVAEVEKPGAQGGWEDASWLFRVVKRALI
ncbi:uncharacterized protein N7443_004477 [Penicillium atrosanguineum]|uniref:uncharacterized protein n=1 Tax=Penicillium atrosanguineum TaxID=1132637 RepID=UPI0023A35E7B|nr:uncharacterized protein N7443_004477 [Penicillium atrosanguineum]KAJ5304817.1 hypothetical protein N7443_004477 [Penicillium atrosanguineum]